MSTPTNELDALLMDSLQQLSADFQQREMRLIEQQKSCIESFAAQSNVLTQQNEAITQRLNELTQHYVNTQELMQRIWLRMNELSSQGKK